MKRLLALVAVACLSGCASLGPPIDTRYTAASHSSRVKYAILHYTVGDFPSALNTLTRERSVSSHYLVDADPPTIYRLVDETRRAHHAGVSSWGGDANLNLSSIGIEIVNSALLERPTTDLRLPYPELAKWQPYPEGQVEAVVALVKKIVKEHQVCGACILGHSDIAPTRKQDPGPLFPWKRLADACLIAWPDAALVAWKRPAYEKSLPDIEWFQEQLWKHGYGVPRNGQFDDATQHVIAAFQMKYRPAKFDGIPDGETAAILDVVANSLPNARTGLPVPRIASVAEWGGTPADTTRARRHTISRITLHHEGVPHRAGRDPAEYLRSLQNWSRKEKGWIDIPYHYIVDLDGNIHEGRDIAFAGDTNTEYDPAGHALVEVVGNLDLVEPTPAQLDALVRVSAWLARKYSVSPDAIAGHRDYAKTDCPGKNLYKHLEDGSFRARVRALLQ